METIQNIPANISEEWDEAFNNADEATLSRIKKQLGITL
jgi:hypothetical protein